MRTALLLLLSAAVTSCFSPPPSPSAPPEWVGVFDARGALAPPDAIPRDPCFVIEPIDRDGFDVMLVAPRALARDATTLTHAGLARLLEVALSLDESEVDERACLRPSTPLERASAYELVVVDSRAANARVVFRVELRVSNAPGAGATVAETWPSNGTVDVSPNLALLALRFDGYLADPEVLVEAPRTAAVRLTRVPCAPLGFEDGDCFSGPLAAPLQPATDYTFAATHDVFDLVGGRVLLPPISFRTARHSAAVEAAPLECVAGETALDHACVFVDDESVSVRATFGRPVRAHLVVGDVDRGRSFPWGDVLLRVGELSAGTALDARLQVFAEDGDALSRTFVIETHSQAPPIGIVEVCANPRGPEPSQEYVELVNAGPFPVSTAGLSLSDSLEHPGDPLPSATVGPGARALVVPSAFDARDPFLSLAAGVALLRVDASLGRGGLSNSGEPLYLRDEAGRLLSQAPAVRAPDGLCFVRTAHSLRDHLPNSFSHANRTPTPGIADELEPTR
jgi:hypothetical protein